MTADSPPRASPFTALAMNRMSSGNLFAFSHYAGRFSKRVILAATGAFEVDRVFVKSLIVVCEVSCLAALVKVFRASGGPWNSFSSLCSRPSARSACGLRDLPDIGIGVCKP